MAVRLLQPVHDHHPRIAGEGFGFLDLVAHGAII
jgi:hypothetical protein